MKAQPDTNAWVFLGSVLARLGEHAEAERCHRNAIEFGTECADEAYLNLGLVLRAEGEYQAAIDCFTKAIELDPQYGEAKLAKRDAAAALRLRNAEPPKSRPQSGRLDTVSNREDPLQVSGDIVNTRPSGTKPR